MAGRRINCAAGFHTVPGVFTPEEVETDGFGGTMRARRTAYSALRIAFCSTLLAYLIVADGLKAYAGSPSSTVHEVIATGDEVRDFGRIGNPGLWGSGIDANGRVLFGSNLSDGRLALFLGDGERVELVWASDSDKPNLGVYGPHGAKIAATGRVVASGSGALFEVRNGSVIRIFGVGDITAEGDTVCGLGGCHER